MLAVAGIVVLVFVVGGVFVVRARRNDDASALAARQAQVAQNGARVMPFDQSLTTHHFSKTDTGGVETVTANNPSDTQQATLVQEHLQHERDLFATGDFSDPMAIHGHAMPGVASMAGAARSGLLTVTYATVPGGARLVYRADSPAVVDAVHAWFDAQLRDHAAGATT